MNETQKALLKRYAHLHPLIFQRSLEKAQSDGELFDILETIPEEMPIMWDEENRRWAHTEDVLQGRNLKED